MRRLLFSGLLALLCSTPVKHGHGQSLGQIQWQQSFGGTGYDSLRSLREIPEGGYIFAGFSNSSTNGNKTSPNLGGYDYWVIRVNAKGDKLWERSFGGSSNDFAYAVATTSDGGFILGGESFSDSNTDKTSPNFGGSDYWVIRLDGGGNKLWEATFGGSSDDILSSLQQTSDGGCILGGWSFSPADGSKVSTNFGYGDVWLIRLDNVGNKLWESSYGGTGNDTNVTIQATADGGFIFGAISTSGATGNKTNVAGGAWIVRLDRDGNKQWEKVIRNIWTPYWPIDIRISPILNEEFLVSTLTYRDPCSGAPCPYMSLFLARLDANGNQGWSQNYDFSYGVSPPGNLASVSQTTDGGIATGHTPPGASRYYVMRLENTGNAIWAQQFGASGFSYQSLSCLERTRDGGFILGGDSAGAPSGNKTSPYFGSSDFWVLKLFPERPHLQLLPATNQTEKVRFLLQTSYFGSYAVDRSADLVGWQPWQTNAFTGTTLEFVDRDTNQASAKFFRARRLP